jgi:hypothetical protein
LVNPVTERKQKLRNKKLHVLISGHTFLRAYIYIYIYIKLRTHGSIPGRGKETCLKTPYSVGTGATFPEAKVAGALS